MHILYVTYRYKGTFELKKNQIVITNVDKFITIKSTAKTVDIW